MYKKINRIHIIDIFLLICTVFDSRPFRNFCKFRAYETKSSIMWYCNIIFGIIGSIIFALLFWAIVTLKYKRKFNYLKGTYQVYEKGTMEKQIGDTIEIIGVCGNKISVRTNHPSISQANGEIRMSFLLPLSGKGQYSHDNIKDGWGSWDVQVQKKVKSKSDILIDKQYQKPGEPHFQSWVWRKIND